LRITAVVFAVAVLLHGADHLRRGVDSVTGLVLGAGTTQFAAGAVAVVLVFRRHRLAAAVAAVVGLASAVGFAAAHLLPQWSAWSDPFTGRAVAPHVNAFSWFTALFEITADLAFGVAGLQLFRARTGDASGSAARARGRIAGVGPGIPS
jgi:lysylphosphatidylglycerol synthetase-like protein (DUF2156 family)